MKKIKRKISVLCLIALILTSFPVFGLNGTYNLVDDLYNQKNSEFEYPTVLEYPAEPFFLENKAEIKPESQFNFEESDVVFKFELHEVFEENFNATPINEKFGEGFDLREKAQSLKLEFQELYPDLIYPVHTIFIIREYDEMLTNEAHSEDNESVVPFVYAAISVLQMWEHIGNQIEFRFRMDTVFSFPPRPSRPILQAISEIRVATVYNANIQHLIHSETFHSPSYGTWHGVRVNTNTMHFRFTVTLIPRSGVITNPSNTANWLLNRTGHVWSHTWNRTCSLTGLQITPPPTHWNHTPGPRPPSSSYRVPYIDWVRANFDPNFNWDNRPIHHIRPLNWGGANALGNLIHLTTAQHTPITGWFAGY